MAAMRTLFARVSERVNLPSRLKRLRSDLHFSIGDRYGRSTLVDPMPSVASVGFPAFDAGDCPSFVNELN